MTDHTLKFYGEELALLKAEVARMGGLVERQAAGALKAIVTRDRILAETIVEGDRQIDELQAEIERQSVRLIALRQPLAQDLRRAVGALKLSLALERAGDYAKNIAKRAVLVAEAETISPMSRAIDQMGRLVLTRLTAALDAYGAGDVAAAAAVWSRDDDVDEHYNSLFRNLLTYMMSDPRTIGPCAQLLFVAKNLERIGDYATTVAEVVRYEVEGEMAGPRPKWEGVPQAPEAPSGDPSEFGSGAAP